MPESPSKPLSAAALRDLEALQVLTGDSAEAAFSSLPGVTQKALGRWLGALARDAKEPGDRSGAIREAIETTAVLDLLGAAERWRKDLQHQAIALGTSIEVERARMSAIDEVLGVLLQDVLAAQAEACDEKLERHARLITIGQVTASIGHDLRSPLSVIESSLFILGRRSDLDDATVRHLDKIKRQVDTCHQIVADLLNLARHAPPKLARVDAADLFTAALTETAAERPGLGFETRAPPALRLTADPGLITRALVNLIANAARAIGKGPGTIILEATATEGAVCLSVSDDGPGFSPSMLRRAFEPLVTTQDEGVGLGLALVGAIAERHGGHARAVNQPGSGARVIITLPDHRDIPLRAPTSDTP